MDPRYESDGSDHETEDSRRDHFWRSRGSADSRRVKEPISPEGHDPVKDTGGSPVKISPKKLELSRSVSGDDFSANAPAPCDGDMVIEDSCNSETDLEPPKSNNTSSDRTMNAASELIRFLELSISLGCSCRNHCQG